MRWGGQEEMGMIANEHAFSSCGDEHVLKLIVSQPSEYTKE